MYNNKNSKHTILIKNSGTDFIYFRDFNIFLYEQEEYINNLIDINYLYYFDLNSNQKFIIDKSIGISPIIFFRSFKNILAFNKDKYLLKDIFSNNFYLIEKNKIKKIKLDKDLVLIKYFSNNNLLIASKTNYADDSIKLFYYNIK